MEKLEGVYVAGCFRGVSIYNFINASGQEVEKKKLQIENFSGSGAVVITNIGITDKSKYQFEKLFVGDDVVLPVYAFASPDKEGKKAYLNFYLR